MTTRSALVVAALGLACTPKSEQVGQIEDTGDGPGTASDDDSSSESDSVGDDGATSTNPTSGNPGTSGSDTGSGVAACTDITDPDICGETRIDDLPCAWQYFTPVTRDGDTCEILDSVTLCVQMTGDTTDAGCGSTPGCNDGPVAPFYKVLGDGTVLIGDYCGGSPPVEWTMCETGYADDEVPECACLCELGAQGDTSSTG